MWYPLRVLCTSEYTRRTSVYRASSAAVAVMFSVVLPDRACWGSRQLKIISFLSVFPVAWASCILKYYFWYIIIGLLHSGKWLHFHLTLEAFGSLPLKLFQIKAIVASTCGEHLLCNLSNITYYIIELESNSLSSNFNTQICILSLKSLKKKVITQTPSIPCSEIL